MKRLVLLVDSLLTYLTDLPGQEPYPSPYPYPYTQAKNPVVIQSHLKKLFAGIHRVPNPSPNPNPNPSPNPNPNP